MSPLSLKVAVLCPPQATGPDLEPLLARVVQHWRYVSNAELTRELAAESHDFDVLLIIGDSMPEIAFLDSVARVWLTDHPPAAALQHVARTGIDEDLAVELRRALVSAANLAMAVALRDSLTPRQGSDVVHLRPEPPRLDDFKLHFQPLWSIDGSRLIGAEALLRWHGLEVPGLKPETVIANAEARGEMTRVGDFVVKRALWHLGEWRNLWPDDARLAINLAPVQLDAAFAESVMDALDRYRLTGADLELEIAAVDLPRALTAHADALDDLLDLGVSFCIDRLGTDLIEPTLVSALPLSSWKIDRAIIERLAEPATAALVAELSALGHHLGIRTIAMGVETESQRHAAETLGCDAAQGFLFAEALSAADFTALLEAHQERRREAS
jgi:EAL domain-containing protein (putative c-di-GMP-specific phosphodiesterase class I)